MYIEEIRLYRVSMPPLAPWRTAYGEDPTIDTILCCMKSDGIAGWGESTPLAAPLYSPEWAGGVFSTCQNFLAPTLIGKDIKSGKELQKLLSLYKGNPFSKSALDTAWWALESKLTKVPLHQLLGAHRSLAPVGADFAVMDDLDDLLCCIDDAHKNNFSRIKLKYRPGWSLNMLKAVRNNFPEDRIHIDCNSGYRLTDLNEFQQIDEFKLEMIEQPLQHDDLLDHAELQRNIKTPICLDESITGTDAARKSIELKSCRFINVKPGRVGGLTIAVEIHDLCLKAGIPCWVGSMLESGIGTAHLSALAMLENFTYPGDIFPSSRHYERDLSVTPLELVNDSNGIPSVKAPKDIPSPDPDRLREWTLESAVFNS
jgi:O-succinylbenzoate synthase